MLKVQTYDPALGWIHATRAGACLSSAWGVLAGYRRCYPSGRHRLVAVSETGSVQPIAEDLEATAALTLSDELATEETDR